MKAYVYTLFALLILVSAMIIIYLNAEASKNVNEFYNEMFRSQAIVFTIENLNEDFFKDSFNISLTYNLLLLTNYSVDNPFRNEIEFYEAVKNLTIYGRYDRLISNISVIGLIDKISQDANMRGILINVTNANLEIAQTDYDKLTYNYSIELLIYDIYNKTGKNVVINSNNNIFDINGMPDPLFMRYAKRQNINLNGNYPAIFVRDNPSIYLASISGFGQGWVYGRVFTDIREIRDNDEPNILMGDFAYVRQHKDNPNVHGFIITNFEYKTSRNCRYSNPMYTLLDGNDTEIDIFNDIRHQEEAIPIYDQNGSIIGYNYQCNLISSIHPTNKPWIAIHNNQLPLDINDYNNKTILILTNNPTGDIFSKSGGSLYRIEDLRDFVNCGYYFKLSNQAPSYVQRFLQQGHNMNSTYGIDIILIEDDFIHNSLSSILSERYSSKPGKRIRGLAGCKLECNQPTRISEELANTLGIWVLLLN